MGVVPWSPLGGGRLSGKYTRANPTQQGPGRAAVNGPRMTEKLFDIVEELGRTAEELGTTVPRVALAWVTARPGVSSTIMGARTLAQLEDNLKALEVELSAEQTARLDGLSTPQLPFPIPFLTITPDLHQGGTVVNDQPSKLHSFVAQRPGDHY